MAISLSTYYDYLRAMTSSSLGQTSQTMGITQSLGQSQDQQDFTFEAALTDMIQQSRQAYQIIAEKRSDTDASSTGNAVAALLASGLFQPRLSNSGIGNRFDSLELYQAMAALSKTNSGNAAEEKEIEGMLEKTLSAVAASENTAAQTQNPAIELSQGAVLSNFFSAITRMV